MYSNPNKNQNEKHRRVRRENTCKLQKQKPATGRVVFLKMNNNLRILFPLKSNSEPKYGRIRSLEAEQ